MASSFCFAKHMLTDSPACTIVVCFHENPATALNAEVGSMAHPREHKTAVKFIKKVLFWKSLLILASCLHLFWILGFILSSLFSSIRYLTEREIYSRQGFMKWKNKFLGYLLKCVYLKRTPLNGLCFEDFGHYIPPGARTHWLGKQGWRYSVAKTEVLPSIIRLSIFFTLYAWIWALFVFRPIKNQVE